MNDETTYFGEDNSEMYEHHRVVADPGQALLRVDKFLMNHVANVSRNKLQDAAKAGNVLVNDSPVKSNYKVRPGDVVTIVVALPPRITEVIPQDLPLDIVYEDDHVILLNKAAGMVVHPAYANYDGTLLNGLAWYFQETGQKIENGFGYMVHRIDKDTSGLLLLAKNELAQTRLASQFFHHTVERKYVALVWGDLEEDKGTIEGHVGRSPKDRRVMTVYPEGDYGKHAISHYSVIRRFGYTTLVECTLETGRTHQIRAHFKYLGHPLFNDARYGGDTILKGTTFTKYKQFIQNCYKILPRQALHAKTLGFDHPSTGKREFFTSELPEDMQQVIEKWEVYTSSRNIE